MRSVANFGDVAASGRRYNGSSEHEGCLRAPQTCETQAAVQGVGSGPRHILPVELLTTLRAQNPEVQLEASEFYLRTTYKEKSGNNTHIFDVTSEGYKKMQNKQKLNLGWTSCPVNENFYIPRCQRCSQYGHIKTFCGSEIEFCPLCAGTHSRGECTIKEPQAMRCRACVARKADARHEFGHAECGTLAIMMARIRAELIIQIRMFFFI